MTALIIGAAPAPSRALLAPFLQEKPLVICADGGLLQAQALGLSPDVYVGDSDSGGSPPPGLEAWLLPREKDLSDLEMGVQLALSRGADTLLLCGCTGGRADHHLVNFYLLERLALAGKRGLLLDAVNLVSCLLPGEYRIENSPRYRYFALLPLDRSLEGLCLSGCKYPLDGAEVPRGSSLLLSNEFLEGEMLRLSFTRGNALFVRSVPEWVK